MFMPYSVVSMFLNAIMEDMMSDEMWMAVLWRSVYMWDIAQQPGEQQYWQKETDGSGVSYTG